MPPTTPAKPEPSLRRELQTQGAIVGVSAGAMWLLEIVDTLLGGALDRYGIQPRTVSGLSGVLFAPFLHGGFAHLAANTAPFVVLGWMIMLRRKRDFFLVFALTAALGGLATWLLGRSATHIGASGVIFGFFGYLLLRGFFDRKLGAILGSLVVLFLYGGMLWGVLPNDPRVSWESHLFGFAAGVLAAWLLRDQPAPPRVVAQK